jgi:hypothetical protein
MYLDIAIFWCLLKNYFHKGYIVPDVLDLLISFHYIRCTELTCRMFCNEWTAHRVQNVFPAIQSSWFGQAIRTWRILLSYISVKLCLWIPVHWISMCIQLWGTTSNSNIEILERFQSKVLRLIRDAPWYVSNSITCNKWPSNTNSQRRNQPIQLPLQCSYQCTPQRTHRLTHRAACVDTGPTTCLSDSSNLY